MASTKQRESWVDIAKGIAISLVVLFHAVIFLDDIGLAGVWAKLSAPLDTFRMPLFFFTTGLFARKAMAMSLRELWRSRIANLVWLYALWTAIWIVVFQFLPLYREADVRGNPLLLWLRAFVWPNESTWFVYILAAYFVLAWAMRRFPVWAQLGSAAVLAAIVGSSLVTWENGALEKSCMYFVFYLAAVHLGPALRGRVPRVHWGWAVGAASVYAIALVIALRIDAMAVPGVRLALGAVGVAAGIGISVCLSRSRWFGWLDRLGTRTLPVYFVHFYVVLGAVAILAPLRDSAQSVQLVWVPAITALAVVVSLLIHLFTRNVPGLWSLPRRRRQLTPSV